MTYPLEQAIKEKIRNIAKERETSFAELWRNLILERFLARLSYSEYKETFILKGGNLLARYLPLGRETKDLDFFIHNFSNSEDQLEKALHEICKVDLQDSFVFEILKILPLKHIHMPYTGAQVKLIAKFGGTKTNIPIDLGFGDIVEAIEHPINLLSNAKGPLFENKISLKCYPKEFIFAEKLETTLFRGESNSRMKDFHDLYSLISLGKLNKLRTEKAVQLVFEHRNADLRQLPLSFEEQSLLHLEKSWHLYYQRLKPTKRIRELPNSIDALIQSINQWIGKNTSLCNK